MNCDCQPYILGNVAYSYNAGCGCPCHEFNSLGCHSVNCYCQCYKQKPPLKNINSIEINAQLKEVKVENHVLRGTIIKLQDRVKSLEDWKKNVCR